MEHVKQKLLVMAAEAHGDAHGDMGEESEDRWDAWGNWILPWLWLCLGILTINVPSDIIVEFIKSLMVYLTGNELILGH